jgi:FMN phosphatase YigB (HAD superfamily)
MEQKDNIKYILLDIWETLLFSNKNEKNINYDRASIICKATNYGNVGFWKDKIEDEILQFKTQELKGISIAPEERVSKMLISNNINTKYTEKILYEYDKLMIEKYKPDLNEKLLGLLLDKKIEIILISNTGLTTKYAIIEILKRYDIINKFKDMFFSQDYAYCKPNILFYRIPLELYQINKNEVVMYGDSEIMDLKPCEKLGIKCIIKKWRD